MTGLRSHSKLVELGLVPRCPESQSRLLHSTISFFDIFRDPTWFSSCVIFKSGVEVNPCALFKTLSLLESITPYHCSLSKSF